MRALKMTGELPFSTRVNSRAAFFITAKGDGDVQKSAKRLGSPIPGLGETESEKRPSDRCSPSGVPAPPSLRSTFGR